MALGKQDKKRGEKVVRVQKFSDGLFIRIPKKAAEDLGLGKGDYVKVVWSDEEIVIRKV